MQMTPRFASALVYACEIHAGQLRKGTEIPYISHLLGVTSIALDHGATADEALGALLHDAAEDAGGAPVIGEIRARFGSAAAEIVAGCSDTFETPKPPGGHERRPISPIWRQPRIPCFWCRRPTSS